MAEPSLASPWPDEQGSRLGREGRHQRAARTQRLTRTAAEIERAFAQEISLERQRRRSLIRTTEQRSRKRAVERIHKRGSVRFALLVMTLILTAVVVTVAMFATLYLLLG